MNQYNQWSWIWDRTWLVPKYIVVLFYLYALSILSFRSPLKIQNIFEWCIALIRQTKFCYCTICKKIEKNIERQQHTATNKKNTLDREK